MEKLFIYKINNLENKLEKLINKIEEKIKRDVYVLTRLHNYTTCHVYKNVIENYYILLNGVNKRIKLKYKNIDKDYSILRDTVNELSKVYMSLSWVSQLLKSKRKDFIELDYDNKDRGLITLLYFIFLPFVDINKKVKGINLIINNFRKHCENIISIDNNNGINLALSYWLYRNYIIDLGRQRSKYLLPDYDIVETDFKFDFNLKEVIKDLEKISDINFKELYDSFLYEYDDNTDKFKGSEDIIILFELSKDPRNKFLGHGFENSEYSCFLNKVLRYKLPDLYSLDLLYYTLELYPVHRLNQSCRDLGFNSAQVQICYNLLNALPTNTVKEMLDINIDKVRIKKQWYINETSYGVSQSYFEEQFKIIIFMFLNELIDEAWDKTEKVLKQLYSSVEVREEYVEKTPVF